MIISKQFETSRQFRAVEVLQTKNAEEIRAILSILAIFAGARTHAKILINYSTEELLEMERLASEVQR
jgi:hypothetical protein